MTRLLCCAIMFGSMALASCDGRQPTLPFAPTPAPSPSPPTSPGFSLSGVVIEDASGGSRVVPGGTVLFSVDTRPGGRVEVDTGGRYTISGLPAGRFVRVTWIASAETGGLRLHQPCPVNATITGGTELDIEVVRLGSREFTYSSPTLSGVVFETTPQGRRPLGGARVLYFLNSRTWFDAYTQTDADGQYQLCRIPQGAGTIMAGDCNDTGLLLPVEVNGDTVVDVDLTSFNASCP